MGFQSHRMTIQGIFYKAILEAMQIQEILYAFECIHVLAEVTYESCRESVNTTESSPYFEYFHRPSKPVMQKKVTNRNN